jgi:hypothetical protein
MAQQFNPQGMNAQNIKIRCAVLVFIKGSTAPLVLYVKDAQSLYQELVERMQSPNTVLIEKEAEGPLKKVCFASNQISAVAIQEEQFM